MLWQLTKREQRQWERLVRRYSMTLAEVWMQIRQEMLADPAPGEGKQLELSKPTLVGPDYFAKRNVPSPEANVDIFSASDSAQSDAEIGRYLLDRYPSREMALAVHANHLAWFRFWAVRDPNPERRQRCAEMATVREAEMQRLLGLANGERRLRVVKEGA